MRDLVDLIRKTQRIPLPPRSPAAKKVATRPPCCSPEQWTEWVAQARLARPGPAGICEDCMPDFADRMRACGRCARPEIVFVWRDGNWAGALPQQILQESLDVAESPDL